MSQDHITEICIAVFENKRRFFMQMCLLVRIQDYRSW